MIDASLGHSQVETLPLVALILEQRKKGVFKGKVIAISSSDEANEILLAAGCDETVRKIDIGKYISAGKLVTTN
jgi:hypothetical protein